MWQKRLWALAIIILSVGIGWFVYYSQTTKLRPFKLGLDLSGGTHLVYSADTSKLSSDQISDSLATLSTVILRRVDAFGVGEPVVQTQQGGTLGRGDYRLIVELPGVTDVDKAVKMIGETPQLEFKLVRPGMEASTTDPVTGSYNPNAFEDTGLTGAYLTSARIEFNDGGMGQGASQAAVAVNFNSAGAKMFADITEKNVGHALGIFLDGNLISAPVIRERIDNGTAIISGNFTPQEAKELANNLNLGALPVPITLASTQSIGATLGDQALQAGMRAGVIGFILLSIFMILWYRLPGVIAVCALAIYVVLMLAIFQWLPVVLTAAGIAAFILSVGLAVDANILIAERIKEELAHGNTSERAIHEGFAHAWSAIRDSNIAHIIASVILFWLGTSMIKGFALVFGFGVIVSMLSAITISRTFLMALGINAKKPIGRFLMRSGIK